MKKTKLRLKEYLADHKITVLATHMDMTYTQLYKYFKDDANPTLLMLDRLADGLSKLRGEEIHLIDLLEIDGYRYEVD